MDSVKNFLKLTWAKKNLATRITGVAIGVMVALMYMLYVETAVVALGITLLALGMMWLEFQSVSQEEGPSGPLGVLLATLNGSYVGILVVVWSNVIF